MRSPYDVIKKPVVSERSMDGAAQSKYTFEVATDANKHEIKYAVETIFGVKVEDVNTMNIQGKMKRMGVHSGRRPARKKAIIKLKEGSKTIDFFESLI